MVVCLYGVLHSASYLSCCMIDAGRLRFAVVRVVIISRMASIYCCRAAFFLRLRMTDATTAMISTTATTPSAMPVGIS